MVSLSEPKLPRGVPEPISRWSTEQRVATMARQSAVRWLVDNAFVSTCGIQERYPSSNAFLDYRAAGGRGRPWMSAADARAMADLLSPSRYLRLSPSFRERSEVVMPESPPWFVHVALRWLLVNSFETEKAIKAYTGSMLTKNRSETNACRGPGVNAWSVGYLDRIFPDLTCGPATISPHGRSLVVGRGVRGRPSGLVPSSVQPVRFVWRPRHRVQVRAWLAVNDPGGAVVEVVAKPRARPKRRRGDVRRMLTARVKYGSR